jgi:flagellar basal body-associated protein FliL
MAEKADNKKKDEGEAKGGSEHKEKKGGGLLTKLPVLMAGAMIIEAVVLVGVFKFMGGSTTKAAHADVELAAEGHGEGGEEGAHGEGAGPTTGPKSEKKITELEVTSFRAPNTQTGRRFIYDVAIFASVKEVNKSKVEAVLKERKATIEDRVRTIIAQSDPDKLGGGSEPGLETLRRQVKYQIEEIAGEGLIEEILVPRCIPFRGD